MKWASAISTDRNSDAALEEVLHTVAARLNDTVTVAFLFASPHHRDAFQDLPNKTRSFLETGALIGCSGTGVVGGGREIEHAPAMTIAAAHMPGVDITATHIEGEASLDTSEVDGMVILADPFSGDPNALVAQLDLAFPNVNKVGGVASGGKAPKEIALFLDDRCLYSGAIVLSLRGDVVLDTAVAQGCKPIGEPMLVTSCEDNVIYSLDEKKPADALVELSRELNDEDRALFRRSLFLGVEMKNQREYKRGDFLIRNMLGLTPDGSALAVATPVQRWQAVQFHLRHATAATEDLRLQLAPHADSAAKPVGALLFSCLGRGEHLYGRPGHDSEMFAKTFADVPLGGFFCNGEIGPVGGTTFVHGYTSAFGLFRQRSVP